MPELSSSLAPAQGCKQIQYQTKPEGKNLKLSALSLTHRAFVRDGKLPPASSAAAGQDVTTVLRFHTFAESVRLGALTVIRLKCSLWH